MGRLRGHGKLPVTAEVVAKEAKGSGNGAVRVSLISAMMREARPVDVLLMFLAILASLANGAMLPLFAVTFGDFVNALTDADVMPRAQKAAVNLAILAAAVLVAFYLQAFLWMWTGAKSSNRLRTKYLAAVLKQDIQYFDTQATTGALLRGLHEDCSAVQRAISEKMGSILQHTSTFALGFALAFYQGWDMTLVLLACLPFLAAVGAALGKMTGRMESKAATAYAAAGDIAQQSLQQLRTVLSYGQQQRMQALYQAALSATTKVGTQQGLVNGLCLGGLNVVLFAAYSGSLFYGAVRVAAGGMTPGGVLAVMMSALLGSFSLGQAAPLVQEILKGQAALESLYKIINRQPNIDVSAGGEAPPSVEGRLEFKAVSFAYPSTPDRLILKQFSISVSAGTTLALVGPSGSGKSTVVSLLQRFYDPAAGALLLDGRDLRTYDLAWLREQMALVSQEPVLFAASIEENIAMGRPGASLSEVQAAAAAANIHSVVVGLPQGYNTPLGDKGLGLSGGQKQRIAIARAILKNPKILLLDEATSALDSANEAAVTAALAGLTTTHQRTCVVVAHRLSTVQGADVIAVVEAGSVVQQGKHSQLLANKQGAYYKLLQLQQSEQQQQQPAQQQQHTGGHRPVQHQEVPPSISGGNLRKRTSSWASCTSNNGPSSTASTPTTATAAGAEGFGNTATAASMTLYNSTTLLLDVGPADLEARGAPPVASWEPPAVESSAAEAAEAASSSRYSTARAFWRLAKMNAREAHLGLLGAVGSFGHGVITPGFALVLALMIGAFTTRGADLRQQASTYSAVLAGIGGWSLVMISMQMWALGAMGCRLASRVRGQLLGALLRQEVGWHDLPRNSPAQLCLLLSQDAGCVRGAVGDLLGMLCQTLGSLALGFGVAFWSDWRMALVVTGTLPLLVVGAVIQTRYAVGGGSSQDKAYSAATQTISEALAAMSTIHSYNLQGWVASLYSDLLSQRSRAVLRSCHLAGLGLGYSQSILFAIMALVVWFGGLEVSSGRASITEVMRAFLCVIFAALGMAQAQVSFPELPRAKAAAQRILALLDRPSPIEGAAGGLAPHGAAEGAVELRGVVFDYPARRGLPVLQGLSVKCAAGTTLALVGPSGSGKSTVVSLLQRFYDPAAGALLLDGRDLRAYDLAWLRQQMALVSQECLLFVGSVRDNIAFGRPGADLAQVMAAAQAAHAHGFIMGLPQGYDTPLGVPGAVQLSGGQKQRLSIARAVLCNPRILLLDEPTSALDAASEAAVSLALAELARGHSTSSTSRRTTIVVAHRLSTIRDADKIAVVVNGVVVEQGSHAELMAAGQGSSQYARLVAAQQSH